MTLGFAGPTDRVFSSASNTPIAVRNTGFSLPNTVLQTFIDLDLFPATHFRLICRGFASEADIAASGKTITMQLGRGSTGTLPASATGEDLVITDTFKPHGMNDPWIERVDGATGLKAYNLMLKGSDALVDLTTRYIIVQWKIAI